MKILKRGILREFMRKHGDATGPVRAWLAEAEEAEWHTPHELRERFPSASFVGADRVIFNIKGNRYRLDVQVNYASQVIVIKRIGTHAEYDKWTFEG